MTMGAWNRRSQKAKSSKAKEKELTSDKKDWKHTVWFTATAGKICSLILFVMHNNPKIWTYISDVKNKPTLPFSSPENSGL